MTHAGQVWHMIDDADKVEVLVNFDGAGERFSVTKKEARLVVGSYPLECEIPAGFEKSYDIEGEEIYILVLGQ